MIADIMLGIITLAVIAGHCYYVREANKEKSKLVNALIAKTPEQLRDLDMADKAPLSPVPTPADLIPEQELSLEEWEKNILNHESN